MSELSAHENKPMKKDKASTILAIGVAISLVIVAGFGGAYYLFWKGPIEVGSATKEGVIETANAGYDLLKRAGKDFHDALGFEPKVVIGSTTVHGPASKDVEIVTATKSFQHTYSYEVTWGGSKKRLKLKGDFIAKAGFPVDESFALIISEDGKTVQLQHKAPEILSCEMTNIEVIQDENGWWNKIQTDERESAQNELLRQARQAANEPDLMNAANENLVERLAPLQSLYSFKTESEVQP